MRQATPLHGLTRSIGWTGNKTNATGLYTNLAVPLWTLTRSLSLLFKVSLWEQSLEGQVGETLTLVVEKWGGTAAASVHTSASVLTPVSTRFSKNRCLAKLFWRLLTTLWDKLGKLPNTYGSFSDLVSNWEPLSKEQIVYMDKFLPQLRFNGQQKTDHNNLQIFWG